MPLPRNSQTGSFIPPARQIVLWLCVAACIANVLLVGVLVGTGVLKSAQPGDVEYTTTQTGPEGNITVPTEADYRYAIERPTDADAFYNMVVRVRSGGPLYNTWQPDNIQEFHYLPVTYYFFAAISQFGYVTYKFALFGLSLLATASGTYLLLNTEASYVGFDLSEEILVGLSIASLGFAPMVANFKIGQVTPFAYSAVAVAWWAYRRADHEYGGVALAIPALFKPYWMAPVALFASTGDRRWYGILGFVSTFLIGNLLSVAGFGLETTLQYYSIIFNELLAESASSVPITEWSVEAIRPFWFLGDVATVGRLLTAVPVFWVWMQYARGESDLDVSVFAVSIVMLFTVLRNTTLIDLGLVLAVFLVLGVHFYRDGGWPLALLGGSFIFAHAHTYVMEVLVGNGHTNLAGITGGEPMLKLLQPAAYAVLLLYLLCIYQGIERLNPPNRN